MYLAVTPKYWKGKQKMHKSKKEIEGIIWKRL